MAKGPHHLLDDLPLLVGVCFFLSGVFLRSGVLLFRGDFVGVEAPGRPEPRPLRPLEFVLFDRCEPARLLDRVLVFPLL